MTFQRRDAFKRAGLALALASLSLPTIAEHRGDEDDDEDDDGHRHGRVFTSTNAVAGNELLVFAAAHQGGLGLVARVATQGLGTGTGLGNQGAVTLSGSGRFLFVVNALSNSISTFAIRRKTLVLRSTVDSGGQRPVSVTEHDGLVYVVNAEGAGNVTGFRNLNGILQPVSASTQPLSAAGGTAPAQIGFSTGGEMLLSDRKGHQQAHGLPRAIQRAHRRTGAHALGRSDTLRFCLRSPWACLGLRSFRRGRPGQRGVILRLRGQCARPADADQHLGRHDPDGCVLGGHHAPGAPRLRHQHRQRNRQQLQRAEVRPDRLAAGGWRHGQATGRSMRPFLQTGTSSSC